MLDPNVLSAVRPRGRGRGAWARLLGAALVVLLSAGLFACGDDESATDGDNGTQPGITGAGIQGLVTDLPGGQRLAGIEVTVRPWFADPAKTDPSVIASTRTDVRGRFVVDGLAAGSYLLVVNGYSYEDIFDPSVGYSRLVLGVELASNQLLTLDGPVRLQWLDLESGLPYMGNSSATLSYAGMEVELPEGVAVYPAEAPLPVLTATNFFPEWAAADMPAGVYPTSVYAIEPLGTLFQPPAGLSFANEGWEPGTQVDVMGLDPATRQWKLLSVAEVDEGTGRVTSAEPYLDRTTQLMVVPPAFDVSGRIVHDTEGPLQGVQVELIAYQDFAGPWRPTVMSTTTNANGDYSFTGVRVTHPGIRYTWAGTDGTYTEEFGFDYGTETLDTIQLAEPNRVSLNVQGVVYDQQGSPLSGVEVRLYEGFILMESEGFVPQRAPLLEAPWSAVSGANGSYSIEGVVATPGQPLGLEVYDLDTGLRAQRWIDAPDYEDTGITITEDIRTCVFDELCGYRSTWELNEDDELLLYNPQALCFESEGDVDTTLVYDVLALSDGVVVMERQGDGITFYLERVGGTGPDGVSTANLVGLYYVRPQASKAASGEFVLFQQNGIYYDWGMGGVEAGGYTAAGNVLTLTQQLPENDLDPVRVDAVQSGDDLALYYGTTLAHVLQRCEWSGTTGLEGVWYSYDPYVGRWARAVFYRGEYLLVVNTNF